MSNKIQNKRDTLKYITENENKMQIDKNIMVQKYSYAAVTVCKLHQRCSGETTVEIN